MALARLQHAQSMPNFGSNVVLVQPTLTTGRYPDRSRLDFSKCTVRIPSGILKLLFARDDIYRNDLDDAIDRYI